MKRLIVLICLILLFCGLCACNNSNTNEMTSYVGNTYEGTTPWGDPMEVKINSIDDSAIEITLDETISSIIRACKTYDGTIVNDNILVMQNNGEVVEEKQHVQYGYLMRFEFTDDAIVVTYKGGEAIDISTEGEKTFRQVDSLSDKEKTVVLKRK